MESLQRGKGMSISLDRLIIGGRAHTIRQIEEVCGLGLPFAEISLNEPSEVEKELSALKSLKDRFGITYLAHYPNEGNPFDADSLEKNFVPKIRRLLELSRELEIPKGTIHFWMDKRWADKELIHKKIHLLKGMADYAKEQGVVLCIENLSERFDSFRMAFEEIPSLRMTLDIGHGQLISRENTAYGFMRQAFDKIAHIHVHDNHGGTSVKDDQHLSLGRGIIDYPGILKEVASRGYSSSITMEVKPEDMPETKDVLGRYLSIS
jgi:sugar phosphate isomerase/epimerase